MKAKKGFNLRNVCGEYVIVAEGIENIDFTNIISMNESSAYLWKKIQSCDFFDEKTLSDLLTDRYSVTSATAINDSKKLIEDWLKAGIIEN
ncbi:PqqD family protein [uncultured Prevotella sp.]|uniref:PqqD family protein n=1 Tax=uncultured Prevotella sp. TaxID=159272 RepID=UPI002630E17F|nr:PqqD family protein [uncultured Prevotella sp.]